MQSPQTNYSLITSFFIISFLLISPTIAQLEKSFETQVKILTTLPFTGNQRIGSESPEEIQIIQSKGTTTLNAYLVKRNSEVGKIAYTLSNIIGNWNYVAGTESTLSCSLFVEAATQKYDLIQFMPELQIFRFLNLSDTLTPLLQSQSGSQNPIEVGDNCKGILTNSGVFRYDGFALRQIALSNDMTIQSISQSFNYLVASNSLYKWSSEANNYKVIKVLQSHSNYILNNHQNRLVVVGVDKTSNKIYPPYDSFDATQIIYTLVDTANGIVEINVEKTAVTNADLRLFDVKVSPFLTKLAFGYLSYDTLEFTVIAKTIDYAKKTITDMSFASEDVLENALSLIYGASIHEIVLSDNFMLLRNATALVSSPNTPVYESSYQFVDSSIVEIQRRLLTSTKDLTDWDHALIDQQSNEMVVVSFYRVPTGIELDEQTLTPVSSTSETSTQVSQSTSSLAVGIAAIIGVLLGVLVAAIIGFIIYKRIMRQKMIEAIENGTKPEKSSQEDVDQNSSPMKQNKKNQDQNQKGYSSFPGISLDVIPIERKESSQALGSDTNLIVKDKELN